MIDQDQLSLMNKWEDFRWTRKNQADNRLNSESSSVVCYSLIEIICLAGNWITLNEHEVTCQLVTREQIGSGIYVSPFDCCQWRHCLINFRFQVRSDYDQTVVEISRWSLFDWHMILWTVWVGFCHRVAYKNRPHRWSYPRERERAKKTRGHRTKCQRSILHWNKLIETIIDTWID
jgi:hypothetical protein